MRHAVATVFVAVASALTFAPAAPAMAGDFERAQLRFPRVRGAFDAHRDEVERAFRDAGAAWPPQGIYLRAFKLEGELELWAKRPRGDERVRVRGFPICASSGGLGPKRRAGDLQVPEGIYTIDRFNPKSSYHLSLGVSYPNAYDKAQAAGAPAGGDIFIHGDCVTIGCLPLEDGPVEALYVAAVLAKDAGQREIPVHMFPCRFGDKACEAALAAPADDDVAHVWSILREGYAAFAKSRVPPRYEIGTGGYRLR